MFENFTQLDAEQQTLIETFGEIDMQQIQIEEQISVMINDVPVSLWKADIFSLIKETKTHYTICVQGVPTQIEKQYATMWNTSAANPIAATLKERGNRYGEFDEHARITQNIKGAMHDSPNWRSLSNDKKETLEMIAHKIGRILNGDPDYIDNWHDIQGYTKLVEDILQREQTNDVK